MCLIAFALNSHPIYPLIIVANRDEFYDRPTKPLHFWKTEKFYGGKDLKAGGTWMGFTEKGRFGAITNYRDLKNIKHEAESRGNILTDYFTSGLTTIEFLNSIHKKANRFNGFNFLGIENGKAFHYSNYEGKINVLDTGVFGLSNALLDTSWPKVDKLKHDFTNMISTDFTHLDLLTLLEKGDLADDSDLPNTGVPHDLEKSLSAICIRMENYGTCSSTVIRVSDSGTVKFTEKSHPVGARKPATRTEKFQII